MVRTREESINERSLTADRALLHTEDSRHASDLNRTYAILVITGDFLTT